MYLILRACKKLTLLQTFTYNSNGFSKLLMTLFFICTSPLTAASDHPKNLAQRRLRQKHIRKHQTGRRFYLT